jgi:5-methylcytosine-specific restriction protein A
MLTVITEQNRIDMAQEQFLKAMQSALRYNAVRELGFQGDHRNETVYYDDTLGLWFASSKDVDGMNRYWNPLGTQNISENKSLNITVELNFPFELNRRVAGVFLEDENGEIFIGHRGRVGGGKPGIGKNAFMQFYHESRYYVSDVGKETEIILISELDSPLLAENIKAFANAVESFKSRI